MHSLKAQRDLALQTAKDAKRVTSKLNLDRQVDEDMYMHMCENVREKDLEVCVVSPHMFTLFVDFTA